MRLHETLSAIEEGTPASAGLRRQSSEMDARRVHENTWKCGELKLCVSPSAGERKKKGEKKGKKKVPPENFLKKGGEKKGTVGG